MSRMPARREILSKAWEVPSEEVSLMLGRTAAKVYGFDERVLQKVADVIGPTVDEIDTPLVDPPSFPDETVTPALAPAGISRR
jgi:hypothetical protein